MTSRGPNYILLLCALTTWVQISPALAQSEHDLSGRWKGKINAPGQVLKFDIEFQRKDERWTGDISIPIQNVKDLPLAAIELTGAGVHFELPGIAGDPKFAGMISNDGETVSGDFSQSGQTISFTMTRGEDLVASAKEALQDYAEFVEHARENWNVPGFAIGIVIEDELVFARGFGHRDIENDLPVTTKTLFAIGSCTKAFTTFTLGTLVDEGIVEWDQPVIDYLPGFRMHDRDVTTRLTVRDLVTHRSGLPRHDLAWYNSPESREELVRRIRYLPLSKGLREKFQYNNMLFMTAGYLTGQMTDSTWEDAVRSRVFKKLGMNDSNFSVLDSQKSPDHALPYEEKDDETRRVDFRNIVNVGPAGSINSNIEDMARWLRVHINDGKLGAEQIIESSLLKDMHTPHMAIAILPRDSEFSPRSYGLGWGVGTYQGHLRVSHGGGIDGFITHVAVYPNDHLGVVAFMNITNSSFPSLMARHAVDRILDLPERDWNGEALEKREKSKEAEKKAEEKKEVARKADTKPAHPLEEYAGQYEHSGYGPMTVAVSGDTVTITYNNIVTPFEHWHYETFNGLEIPDDHTFEDFKIRFLTNMNGDVNALAAVMERTVDEIIFSRKADRRMSDPEYLARFVGQYELATQTVTVSLTGNALTVSVPGQATYELTPDRDDRFDLEGINGFSVEFTTNDEGKSIARFHQPNGVFDATKKES